MTNLKQIIKSKLANAGLYINRSGGIRGYDIEQDLKLVVKNPKPILFDVGANRGQTIRQFLGLFNDATIHAFEPSSTLFPLLQQMSFPPGQVILNNLALGPAEEQKEFINYNKSGFNSFLEVNRQDDNRFADYLQVKEKETVTVATFDGYIRQNGIKQVDLLKVDTQGFDLQVLTGATESLKAGIVKAVFVEINFTKLYVNQNSPEQVMTFLREHNFDLIDFYDKTRKKGALAWCNGLFLLKK